MARRLFDATGYRETAEYRSWISMRHRCLFPNDIGWNNYGGRGISICERWQESFLNFLADVGTKPSSDHSLDRFPNYDGNYEPGNVRWATRKQQQDRNNQRPYRPRRQQSAPGTQTGLRGIEKIGNRWRAIFRGEKIGGFKSVHAAINAWNAAVASAYGEGAWLNPVSVEI